MNIYFACSITGGREFEPVYQGIVRALMAGGHEVPTAHLAQSDVMTLEQVIAPAEVYTRDALWIHACDVLIAEVSVPSHGVGYEIGFALSAGKRVLCLFRRDRRVSKMIAGNPDKLLTVKSYENIAGAVEIVNVFLGG